MGLVWREEGGVGRRYGVVVTEIELAGLMEEEEGAMERNREPLQYRMSSKSNFFTHWLSKTRSIALQKFF